MEWILDHIQLVIAIVIIAYFVLRRMAGGRRAAGEDGGEGRSTDSVPTVEEEAEMERTRQIQEEIRRRILARQRGEAPAPAPPPLPVSRPVQPPPVTVTRPVIEEEEREWFEEGPRPRPAQPAMADGATAAILERQRALGEQLEALRSARVPGPAWMPATPASRGSSGVVRSGSLQQMLREDLSGTAGLRRAILLRVVLGEPPGLQRGKMDVPRR